VNNKQIARVELVKQGKVRYSLRGHATVHKNALIITKIHRLLSFTQRAWIKPWIDLCNEQRKPARSEFESD